MSCTISVFFLNSNIMLIKNIFPLYCCVCVICYDCQNAAMVYLSGNHNKTIKFSSNKRVELPVMSPESDVVFTDIDRVSKRESPCVCVCVRWWLGKSNQRNAFYYIIFRMYGYISCSVF